MQAAEGLLVTFHVNASQEVLNLYRRGSVYWHATGVGADLVREPGLADISALVWLKRWRSMPAVRGRSSPTAWTASLCID
jgi:hypothetical protein